MKGYKMQFLNPRSPLSVGLLLLALAAPARADNAGAAPPAPAPATGSDPAFDRYVDLDLLGAAWAERDAELLTDLGLQLAEGERVLLRPHKAITADQVLSMAAAIAAERKDRATLSRLATALKGSKNGELAAQVAMAQKLAAVSRAPEPGLTVQVDQVSPGAFLAFQATLQEIADAKVGADTAALDSVLTRIPDMKQLTEAQRGALLKAAKEARAALPKDGADVDPAIAALDKLAKESRNPPHHNMSRPPQHAFRPPQHAFRPPQHTFHPPQHTQAPPQHTFRPPQHTQAPPQHTFRPPQHTQAPPQHTFRPPQHTQAPPQHTQRPIQNTQRPPQHTQRPTQNTQRPTQHTQRPTHRPHPNHHPHHHHHHHHPHNTTVNNNVNNINCVNTGAGFVVGGSTDCPLSSGCTLEPGDVIVSVGGMNCGGTDMSLSDMVDMAYQNGNMSVVVRDCNTGQLQTFQLDPPDAGGQDGGELNLPNTTWVGSENLGNYGRLEFQFQDGGQVTMVDTDGSTGGTYAVDGNTVTLTFYNGSVVYSGTYDGSRIAGTARNNQGSWDFSVSQ